MAARSERSIDHRDGELLELAVTGDRDAFDALLRPRLDRLVGTNVGRLYAIGGSD